MTEEGNSPTICQYYIHKALMPVLIKFPEVFVIPYMDDILFSWSSNHYLNDCLTFIVNKIQKQSSFNYLGYIITQQLILHHPLNLKTMYCQLFFKKSHFSGIHAYVPIITDDLATCFKFLSRNSQLNFTQTTLKSEQVIILDNATAKMIAHRSNHLLSY